MLDGCRKRMSKELTAAQSSVVELVQGYLPDLKAEEKYMGFDAATSVLVRSTHLSLQCSEQS